MLDLCVCEERNEGRKGRKKMIKDSLVRLVDRDKGGVNDTRRIFVD